MEDYKPNSYLSKSKEKEAEKPEKKIEKVVSGEVKAKKKSVLQRIFGAFVQEDVQSAKDIVSADVIVPAVRKAVHDVITNGADILIYGETGKSKSNSSRTSYQRYYDSKNDRPASHVRTSTYEYDDIIIDNRGEAEEVLSRMDEIVEIYGAVSVADFYDLVGITGRHTDNKYGWSDLRSASVMRVRDGYVIRLPRALPID